MREADRAIAEAGDGKSVEAKRPGAEAIAAANAFNRLLRFIGRLPLG
jgi:hypothetical protein